MQVHSRSAVEGIDQQKGNNDRSENDPFRKLQRWPSVNELDPKRVLERLYSLG